MCLTQQRGTQQLDCLRGRDLVWMHDGRVEPRSFRNDRRALGFKKVPAYVVNETQLPAFRCEAQVCIVFAQQQPVLGAAGKHPIRLAGTAGDQVIDQHADVCLIPTWCPRLAFLHLQGCIDAGKNALRRRFLITCGAVDLAGEKQAADELRLQTRHQVTRIEIVVLDRITGPRNVRVLEAPDRTHQLELHIEWQAGGNAVGIDLVGRQPFRLNENLVRGFVGEAMHLVLDRRTVAGADAFDDAGKHG